MSGHKFKIGESVLYTSGIYGRGAASGVYKVTQLLPSESDDCQYRIKSSDEPRSYAPKFASKSLKIFISAVRETEMIADPKRKPYQDDGDSDKRRRQEEALDEALKNTFPASDPVSVEQPTTSGRASRS